MVDELMREKTSLESLPDIPEKLYFSMGEASELCGVKPHVLRYWETEFKQIAPMKRRGNRRYYQRKDVVLIRTVRELLYGRGFTIEGARQHLTSERQLSRQDKDREFTKQLLQQVKDVMKLLA